MHALLTLYFKFWRCFYKNLEDTVTKSFISCFISFLHQQISFSQIFRTSFNRFRTSFNFIQKNILVLNFPFLTDLLKHTPLPTLNGQNPLSDKSFLSMLPLLVGHLWLPKMSTNILKVPQVTVSDFAETVYQ